MYYALTINANNIITGVHESMSPITIGIFASNPGLKDDTVVAIDSPAEFETYADIRCYNEDGTQKPILWCIENGYMPLPLNKEIINGELVDKAIPAEEQPQTLKEYLDSQFSSIRKESEDRITAVKEESDKKAQSMRPLMTELIKGKPADVVIQSSEFILPWAEGAFILDDVRIWKGQPKRCCQAHDSTGNLSYNPSVASLWAPYHGTTAVTALPWTAPTGAYDMYKANECMMFIDGRTYRCLQDTAYSPAEYPQAWSAMNDAPEEGTIT